VATDLVNDIVDAALDTTVVLGFSRVGIAVRRRLGHWTDELPSMHGRTALVTGASSGLGQATAAALAGLGAEVWLLVRNEAKGRAALDEIAATTGNDRLHLLVADLADLGSVRTAAEQLDAELGDDQGLDVLVNNAGALTDTRHETADGIELTFQVHVVAPFLLTSLLLPRLSKAGGRVITVSSGGLYAQALDIDDLQSEHEYRGSVAYAKAKRAQVLLNGEWAARLAGASVTFHTMHPGWADTPGVESSLPRFHTLASPFLRTPAEGADTIVWLAAAPADQIGSGRFWMDRRPRPAHKVPWTRRGDQHGAELWDRVVAMAGVDPAHSKGRSSHHG
jgi:dehydrogenase/reductase SDR family member 12